MKRKLIFLLPLVFCFVLFGCDTGTTPEENNEPDLDYITVWLDPREKQIDVSEGTKTVALLATGKYCDVYYDKKVSQPTESQLKQIVFKYDNEYKEVTSFLGLYERGGDGGEDNNPRIQAYIYDLDLFGGRANVENGKIVYIDIYSVNGSMFTHELCHLIFHGNHSVRPETWYNEFLPSMAEVVFHGRTFDWSPNVELFGVWNNNGGPNSIVYYNTYRKLAKFLVDKYGNTILYDLYHETAINEQALENVLSSKGQTITNLEEEFADWCDNFGYPDDNETRLIVIDNVSLTGEVGVWLSSDLSSGSNYIAVQTGTISNKTIAFSLIVPSYNTVFWGDTDWLGSGDYYVNIVPIAGSYQWNNVLMHTDDDGTPSKVTFNKAITRLSFEKFKRR
jgi:hypothetical protein